MERNKAGVGYKTTSKAISQRALFNQPRRERTIYDTETNTSRHIHPSKPTGLEMRALFREPVKMPTVARESAAIHSSGGTV